MQESKPIPTLFDTYLAMVKNAVGSKMFRNFYAYVDGQKTDLVNNGDLACAFFVSSVLHNFELLAEVHLTVGGTQKDLIASGWQELEKPRTGSVIVWAEQDFGTDGAHRHIGFYIGDQKAVSTSSKTGAVAEHHLTFDGARSVAKAYWHPKLDSDKA